jgi:hypothetical protein
MALLILELETKDCAAIRRALKSTIATPNITFKWEYEAALKAVTDQTLVQEREVD